MKRVLIITKAAVSGSNLLVTKGFAARLNEVGTTASFTGCAVQDLLFAVSKNGNVSITLEGSELHDICDVIHLRNTNLFADFANAIRLYADAYGIELINRADATLPYYGKLSQGFLFALNGIKTPPFVSSCSNSALLGVLPNVEFGFPLVIKHNDGTMGLDNYLVKDIAEANSVLNQDKEGYLAQQYIANEGELRILRFGDAVEPLIFKKRAQKGSHLNNTSRGGSSTLMSVTDVDSEALDQASLAARLSGREIGGIDVLLGNDGQFYILEVNLTPQIASGALLSEKQKRYAAYFSGEAEEL